MNKYFFFETEKFVWVIHLFQEHLTTESAFQLILSSGAGGHVDYLRGH